MSQKKLRAPNFAKEEMDLLEQLVKKYPIITNSVNDSTTNYKKREAWRKLTDEFNSKSSFHRRNTKQLKNLYKNFKCRKLHRQEQVSSASQHSADDSNGTEDSKNDSSIEDDNMEEDELIWEKDISEEQQMFKLENNSNQDNQESLQHKEDLTMPADKSADPHPDIEEMAGVTEWNHWLKRKELLKQPIKRENTPLSSCEGKKRIRPESHDKLLQSKLELVELIKKHTETEAQLKQDILKEQLKQEKIKTATLQLMINKSIEE